MFRVQGLLLATALAALPAVASAAPIDVKILSELDRFEPFEGHLFHAGHLWVGRSRKDMASYYRLEVFAADGTAQASVELVHSLRYIYPYGDDAILVVGIGLDQVSHYTIARWVNGKVEVKEQTIPDSALADRFAGKPGQLVFSDPGGFDDPDHPSDPNQPLPTLFTMTRGGEPRYLAPRIAGPRNGVMIDAALYLISSPSIATGGRTLNKVDVAAESFTKVLEGRNGLTEMARLPALNLLAITESDAQQVVVVDLKNDRLSDTLSIEGFGRPRALAALGTCLLVGTEDTKQVLVYNLGALEHAKPIAQWDLGVAGDKFFQLRNLTADAGTGHVFARSAYACSPLDGACGANGRNSVIMVTPAVDDAARAECLAAAH